MLPHQQLLTVVIAALSAAPVVAVGGVARQAARPLPDGVQARVLVSVVRSQRRPVYAGLGAPVQWETLLGIDCTARAATGQAADEAVAPLAQAVMQRMAEVAWPASGFELDDTINADWDQEQLDERIGSLRLTYLIRHQSNPITQELIS